MDNPESLISIENMIPSLTIYIPDITWLDPNGFNAESWNTKDARAAVTYCPLNGICKKLYSNGYYLGEIEEGTIPGGTVLIVKLDERVSVLPNTKSDGFLFQFKDEVFNGNIIKTKSNRHNGPITVGWLDGEEPENSSSYMSSASLNNYNAELIQAFNYCSTNPIALQNDYLYYGMNSTSSTGKLRHDVRAKIVRFKISPRSFEALFDDVNDSDTNFVDDYETDDNGKGPRYEPSLPYIYSLLWSEGALEIHMKILTNPINGTDNNIIVYDEYYYDVRARDLFTLNNDSIYREQWGTTIFKWYITWRYSIWQGRNTTTLSERWYYPEYSPDLPTWDLLNNSAYYIVVSEDDSGSTITNTISYITKKSKQSNGKLTISNDPIKDVIKNEFGWSTSDEVTNSGNTTMSWIEGSDIMFTRHISYTDKYIESYLGGGNYSLKSYSSDRFSFSILPYIY